MDPVHAVVSSWVWFFLAGPRPCRVARGGCYMMCNVCVRVKTISIKHDKRQLVWMLTDAGGTIQEGEVGGNFNISSMLFDPTT